MPHGLRMKDQLLTYRPRGYRVLSFGKQVEGGIYPLAKYNTEILIVAFKLSLYMTLMS